VNINHSTCPIDTLKDERDIKPQKTVIIIIKKDRKIKTTAQTKKTAQYCLQ
jgi:hypothetical protein